MKSFRKLACLLCALLMVVSVFAGCNTTPADSSDITSETESEVGDVSDVTGGEDVSDVTSTEDVVSDVASQAGTTSTNTNSTTQKPTNSTAGNNKPTASQGPLNNIPDSEEEKWGTEAGVTSTKKVPAWMKKIKSGEITMLTASAYGEGSKSEAYQNAKEVFKALTGKELKVNAKIIDWNNLRSTLQTMVLSGNGPDTFSIYNGVAYYLRNKGLTRDIRDYINMNDALWDPMKEYSEVMFYKGDLTGVVASTGGNGSSSNGFVYNKKLISQAGLDDPWELYKKGKWNITTFLEYVEELTVDKNHDNTPEVFGVSMAPEALFKFALSSGEDLVKFNDDGSVTNNLRSATFTRYASYARQIQKVGSYDTESWTRAQRFKQGKIAMCEGSIWTQADNYGDMKKKGEIGWVPFPMDVNAKVHYLTAEYTVNFLPKNSKNPEGAAAFLYTQRYMAVNPNAKKTAEEKAKYINEYKYSEDEWAFAKDELKLPFEVKPITFNWMHVPDFKYQSLWNVFTTDWPTLVEEVYPTFDAALKAQNK